MSLNKNQTAGIISTGVHTHGDLDGAKIRGASSSPSQGLPVPRIHRVRISVIESSSPPIYSGYILQGRNDPAGGNPGGASTGVLLEGIQSLNATAALSLNDEVFVLVNPPEPHFVISSGGYSGDQALWLNTLQITAAGAP